MSDLKLEATDNSLTVRDKIFIGLGMTMATLAGIIWLLSEGLTPAFAKQSWGIASPGLTLFTFIVGAYLVLRGTKKLIKFSVSRLDKTLEEFFIYRAIRWIGMKTVLLILFILDFIFSVIADTPEKTNTTNSTSHSSYPREDAWDVASNHYYEKEPPPPFLDDDFR